MDVRVNCLVESIDRALKTVSVRNLKTGEIFTERYDKLILSPGAKPVVPEFCRGGDRVYTLRTVEDELALKEACRSGIATAAVIGGGFIGLETAENLTRAGLKVSLFERGGHVLATVDDEIAARIHAELATNGIKLFTGADTRRLVSRLSHIFMDTINSALFIYYDSSFIDGWKYDFFSLDYSVKIC